MQHGRNHCERCVNVCLRSWNIAQNQIHQRGQVFFRTFWCFGSPTITARCIKRREVELFIGCFKRHEEIEDLVENFFGALIRTVDLIDDDDWLQTKLQGFTQNEFGLWHWAFGRVNQQNNTINHRQDTFDFTTEIGVARGINDVDTGLAPLNCCRLCHNGNAAFAFQIVAVHGAFINALVVTIDARLAEHRIDEGGFAMVNVSDDGDIAQVHWRGLQNKNAARRDVSLAHRSVKVSRPVDIQPP